MRFRNAGVTLKFHSLVVIRNEFFKLQAQAVKRQ